MSVIDQIAKALTESVRNANSRETVPYDTQATVIRVDGDIAWVHIPGGVDETPVSLTVDAKQGDIVQVRVSGGTAWIIGNATSPPTDDTVANEAVHKVSIVRKAVDAVARIAGNTAQYFWHTENGSDTGAHITEIPQEQFQKNPSNGGGNLLLRSNGIAVRDGLTELAAFDGDGIEYNNDSGTQVFEVLTTQNQSIIERGIVNINLSSSTRSGSYSRLLSYKADVIQYIRVRYQYKQGSSYWGASYYYLTPSNPTDTGNHGTAQYTKSGQQISLTITHDGTANATISIYEIIVKYTSSSDGLSKIRAGIYPQKNDFNIFEIGNGTSTSNRGNAFSVDLFGNTSPSMEFAILIAENQPVSGAVNEPVKISRAIANGDCLEIDMDIQGYSRIHVKKKGYYQIFTSAVWSAVDDKTSVKAVLACNEIGGQHGFAYAIGKDDTWCKRTGMDIVYIDAESFEYVKMWARDEGGTSTLRAGQIIVRPVWLD